MKHYVSTYLFLCVVSITAFIESHQDVLTTVSQNKKDTLSDLCNDAKAAAIKATEFARDSLFAKAKENVQLLAMDGKEHGIAFGKNANGNVIASSVSTGNANSATLGNVPNKFADLHNHPRNFPPSSGDVYALIDNASLNNSFETRYIVTPGGTVYALVITDLQQAKAFNTKYPRVSDPGYQPKFPGVIVDEIIDMKGIHNISEEMAMAYVMEHYQMGIALLKQDTHGSFIVLRIDKVENADGTITFLVNNCQ